jgi:hypothetical protein
MMTNRYNTSVGKSEENRSLEDLSIDGRTSLKWNLKK